MFNVLKAFESIQKPYRIFDYVKNPETEVGRFERKPFVYHSGSKRSYTATVSVRF